MRVLLLQEERHLPTFGGGHKANRRLLEELAGHGHACLVVCPAHNRDTPRAEFLATLAGRGVEVRSRRSPGPGLFQYAFRGVEVDGLDTPDLAARAAWIRSRIESWRPDLVLVADDGRAYLLEAALAAAPDRVIFLVHNHRHLPFGPLAAQENAAQVERLSHVRALLVMSRYSRDYVAHHAGLEATPVTLPVDGPGPPPQLGAASNRFVTLIKPIAEKGVDLFLALADRFPGVEFAAVATWGNSPDAAILAALRARPNVHLLPPADDVGEILAQTRVLLVPSLFPETYGLVVPEAMVRGVPVLASDAGALPEARLGVDFQIPVRPMTSSAGVAPPQDLEPWAAALDLLLGDRDAWERCSRDSRDTALAHRPGVKECETLLGQLRGQLAGAA
ncbi:MAG TPA: glycosyltransferase family 4 protein [Thermoanaerobaculia bacterium]|jgi:glycosyltransferase involved in cell wall biosynthesis|nr:glycosyltransferase family 4 protein [Thermoanaerobaculia bacterium]